MAKQSALTKRCIAVAERLGISANEVWVTISRNLENLSTNEQIALIVYFGNTGQDLDVAAKAFGKSATNLGQVKNRAVAKIEAHLRADRGCSLPLLDQEIDDFFNIRRMAACNVVISPQMAFVRRLKENCDPPIVRTVVGYPRVDWLRTPHFGPQSVAFLEAVLASEGLVLAGEEKRRRNQAAPPKLTPAIEAAVQRLLDPVLEVVRQAPEEGWAARITERLQAKGNFDASGPYVNYALHRLLKLKKVTGPVLGTMRKDGHPYRVKLYQAVA